MACSRRSARSRYATWASSSSDRHEGRSRARPSPASASVPCTTSRAACTDATAPPPLVAAAPGVKLEARLDHGDLVASAALDHYALKLDGTPWLARIGVPRGALELTGKGELELPREYVGHVDLDVDAAHGIGGFGVLWGYGSRDELERAGADALLAAPADVATLVE